MLPPDEAEAIFLLAEKIYKGAMNLPDDIEQRLIDGHRSLATYELMALQVPINFLASSKLIPMRTGSWATTITPASGLITGVTSAAVRTG